MLIMGINMISDKSGNKVIEVFDNTYNDKVRHLATNLREADFDEVFASTGESPHFAIQEGWEWSIRKWIMLNKHDRAVAVLGVRPQSMFSDIGIPWLLGTEGLNKIKRFFMEASKPIIVEMLKDYKALINYVDARYIKAVRWLNWCGFEIEDAEPFGAQQLPFHKFSMRSI